MSDFFAFFENSSCFTVFIAGSAQKWSDGIEQCIWATSWQEWVKRSQKLQEERIARGPKVSSAHNFPGNLHVLQTAIDFKEKADKVMFY